MFVNTAGCLSNCFVKMKRACPFETNISRQLKVHLNEFDVNKNVDIIQGETIKKLFFKIERNNDMKNRSRVHYNGNNYADFKSGNKEKFLKQSQVTNYFLNNNTAQPIKHDTINSASCHDFTTVCAYCDKISTLHQCTKCLDSFCQSCSFVMYGASTDDSRICLSCS